MLKKAEVTSINLHHKNIILRANIISSAVTSESEVVSFVLRVLWIV